MRGDKISLLLNEAKRRPDIAALVDRVEELSDADIAQANVPLKWHREALLALRQRRENERTTARILMSGCIQDGRSSDPLGQLVRWMGDDTFLNDVSIKHGRHVFLPKTGGMWNGTHFAKRIDPKVLSEGEPGEVTTFGAYKALCQKQASDDAPIDAPILFGQPTTPMGRLGSLGVRFG